MISNTCPMIRVIQQEVNQSQFNSITNLVTLLSFVFAIKTSDKSDVSLSEIVEMGSSAHSYGLN